MQTVGKRHRRRTPGGDYLSQCFECRAPTLRSDLERRADGNLYHRKGGCGPTKLGVELDRGNAEKSRQRRRYPTNEQAISLDGVEFDTLGQPTNPMVGWVWINVADGTKRDGSSNTRLTKLSTSLFQIELTNGADFSTSKAAHFEPSAKFSPGSIPLLLTLGKVGHGMAVLRVLNRLSATTFIDLTRVFVCLYGEGGSNMLSQVATAWVRGTDGALLDSEGATVTPTRTGAGAYTVEITGSTFRFATISVQVNGDPSGATAVMPLSGKMDDSHLGALFLDAAGVATDTDFCVRLLA